MASPVTPSPVPPPVPVATHPNRGAFKPPTSTNNLLSPEDAYYAGSPPRLRPLTDHKPGFQSLNGSAAANAAAAALRPAVASLRPPPAIPTQARIEQEKRKRRSASRRRQAKTWKKLLWVKQTYPDNYTDEETFLDHLQRNPRFRPYDFWPLVADSTIIVQHVSSVVIFISCFVGMYQDQVSPESILTCGNMITILGWLLWDHWVGQESTNAHDSILLAEESEGHITKGLGLTLQTESLPSVSQSGSKSSSQSESPVQAPPNPFPRKSLLFSSRTASRLKTIKSAILIYFALLGLSPILKSLTRSTAPDSVWALATCLMIMNIVFFDYGGIHPKKKQDSGQGDSVPPMGDGKTSAAKFPASLSTNAALMASTVLASLLPTTTHVFSLTMFSIQIFGLFPVFRRQLRHSSWQGHLTLTVALVVVASGGMGLMLSKNTWAWVVRALLGTFVGIFGTAVICGACSWWLIGLQRYKNVVIGPWDAARPVLKGRPRGMTEG
ncbi:MAG: hypothetical protein Q9160_008324 [Pyrenula sp. 1 TL-2023]